MGDVRTLKEAQAAVKAFSEMKQWSDHPNIDKFDHIHEELISMSQYLRYKTPEECKQIVEQKREVFVDGIGDTLFGLCRLANQLGVDVDEAFNYARGKILEKYGKSTAGRDENIINPDGKLT